MEIFAALDGREIFSLLFHLGLEPESNDREVREQICEYLLQADTEKRALCVSRTGWYGGTFVLPDEIIGQTNEMIVLQWES